MTTRDAIPPKMQRMKIDLIKIILCFFAFLPGILKAQDQVKASYTWDKCVEVVKQGNAELRASFKAFQAERARQLGAAAGFFPNLTATLDGSRTKDEPDVTNYNAKLNLSQNLFDGLQDLAKTKEAKAKTAVALAKFEVTRAKVSYDLKSSFQSLVFATESVKLSEEIVKRRQNNLRLVELRFQSGRENRGSVLLSRAYLNDAKLDSLRAKNSIFKARAQLARALGLDEHEELQVQGEVPVQELGDSTPNFREMALATPEHRRSIAEQDEAEQKIDIARSRFFPRLALSGSIGRQGEDFLPENEQWSVGVNLTLPLFDGFRDYSSTRGAIESFASAQASRMNVDREILTKLRQAFSDYTEAVFKLKVDESFRDAAVLRAEIARNRYNNGLLSFEDWDGIENDLISRQKNYLESRRERVIKEAAWEQAQGRGAIE